MAAGLSALRTGRTLPPGLFIFKYSWYSFLVEQQEEEKNVSSIIFW
jgi:hypothetical protein